jgi:tetratricopeptide (TPR) repeat protein
MRAGWLAGAMALALLSPREVSAQDLEHVVPRLSTPAKQLEHARRLKQARRGRSARDRERWTRKAIEAYRAVRVHHPWATRLSAEAAFRAGELLSASGRLEGAIAEFGVACELGVGTPFRARGWLSVGCLQRRSGDPRAALEAFLSVVADPESSPAYRDDAWLWVGRVHQETGRIDDARQAWRRVVSHARDPLDRVRAYDFLGITWIEEGDLEAAAGVLDECLRALSEQALERTNTGNRVRRGLARMRLVRRLPEEVEARMRSSRSKGTPRKR